MNLGVTQRDIIRQHSEQEDVRLEQFSSAVVVEDVELREKDKKPYKEKTRFFLPKCILLLLVVAILFAGVIVLVYYNIDKDRADRGKVLPADQDECFDNSVTFGEEVRIKCTFSKAIKGKIEAVYKDTVDATTSDFTCDKVNGTNDIQCTAVDLASCKSGGDVEINVFKDDGKTIDFTKTVNVETKGRIETTINQVYNGNTSESIFQLSCTSTGFCSSYEMSFVENDSEKEIAGSMSCETNYSIENGYVTFCHTEISSDVILNFGNKTTMNCQLMLGEDKVQAEFGFPSCTDYALNKDECNQNTTSLYDCSNTNSAIVNCATVCEIERACYSLRVQEFSRNTTSCPTECALKWCRYDDTRVIDASGTLSFNNLCPLS